MNLISNWNLKVKNWKVKKFINITKPTIKTSNLQFFINEEFSLQPSEGFFLWHQFQGSFFLLVCLQHEFFSNSSLDVLLPFFFLFLSDIYLSSFFIMYLHIFQSISMDKFNDHPCWKILLKKHSKQKMLL